MPVPIVQIFVCSTREKRIGLPIGQWVEALARKRDDIEVELIDLKEINLPMFDEPHHPRLGKYEHEHTKRWSAVVSRADGFVFVTPEYNHSFPASLKNAIDYLNAEWKFKPVAFVSYGGVAAGTRAVQALKPVLACFHMMPLFEAVNIPFVHALFEHAGKFRPEPGLEEAANTMLDKLVFWMRHQMPLYREAAAAAPA